jgi:hypothetical protein
MISDGFFTVSFEAIIGFIITIAGIWLVVKQLNETRLATQTEGLIGLIEIEEGMVGKIEALEEYIDTEEWQALSDKEAYTRISENKEYLEGYSKVGRLYELIGVLVRNNALDLHMVAGHYGRVIPNHFRLLEKYIRERRQMIDIMSLAENWEWLTIEIERLDA